MAGFKLDLKGIKEYQQNRHPYLMIDYVDEIIPGKSAKGYKDLKEDEWLFFGVKNTVNKILSLIRTNKGTLPLFTVWQGK